jgi:hypothetical protein
LFRRFPFRLRGNRCPIEDIVDFSCHPPPMRHRRRGSVLSSLRSAADRASAISIVALAYVRHLVVIDAAAAVVAAAESAVAAAESAARVALDVVVRYAFFFVTITVAVEIAFRIVTFAATVALEIAFRVVTFAATGALEIAFRIVTFAAVFRITLVFRVFPPFSSFVFPPTPNVDLVAFPALVVVVVLVATATTTVVAAVAISAREPVGVAASQRSSPTGESALRGEAARVPPTD